MHLNHINLCSSTVTDLAEKLARHFDYRILGSRSFPKPDGCGTSQFALVVGADGPSSTSLRSTRSPRTTASTRRGFHFSLIQDTREDVIAKHEELAAAGLNPGRLSDGFAVWGATWTAFYCPLGDGLEINHRTPSRFLDAQPE